MEAFYSDVFGIALAMVWETWNWAASRVSIAVGGECEVLTLLKERADS